MQQRKLMQRKLLEERSLLIDEVKGTYVVRLYGHRKERTFPIEDMIPDHARRSHGIEWMSLFLTGLFLAWATAASNGLLTAVCIACSLATGTYCWIRSGTHILVPIAGQDSVQLFGRSPNKTEVDRFLSELVNVVRTYSVEKYGNVSGYLPPDQQMQRMTWLRDRNFLNDEEFKARVSQLEDLFRPKTNSPIGFRPRLGDSDREPGTVGS